MTLRDRFAMDEPMSTLLKDPTVADSKTRDVDRDVADTDHGRTLDGQVERRVAVVGVPVVPGDELRRRVAADEILAGNPHAPVRLGARAVDDLVIVPPEVVDGDVPPELDVAVEAELRIGRDLVERRGDRLDLLVVRRDASAHEAVRARQPVVEVDLDENFDVIGSEPDDDRAGDDEDGRNDD